MESNIISPRKGRFQTKDKVQFPLNENDCSALGTAAIYDLE